MINSYLSNRKQCVVVSGKASDLLNVQTDVPQGSIVSPFLYNLYVQELLHILDMKCNHIQYKKNQYLFNQSCDLCGTILTFTDDSSLTVRAAKGENIMVAHRLDYILSLLETFLKLNNLKLIIDKAELLRITSSQQLTANGPENLMLSATNSKGEYIKPLPTTKILGITFQNNLNWSHYFDVGENAILGKCKRKLGALKNVARNSNITFKKTLS